MSMDPQIAIVTGGSRGMGKAMVEVLLRKKYKVAILSLDPVTGNETMCELNSRFGDQSAQFFQCDVRNAEQLKSCYVAVEDEMGKVSVLVNNAGILDETDWRKMADINLNAVIEMTYIGMQMMRRDKGGHGGTIVNISSMAGMKPFCGFPVYAATKWALIGFTKSLADSIVLAGDDWGISLLTMCPSYVDTDMVNMIDQCDPSPAVPSIPCKHKVLEGLKQEGVISLPDYARAFDKLLNDNKNGSVLWVVREQNNSTRNQDVSVKAVYVEQEWK